MIKYTLELLFPSDQKKSEVAEIDYQVTSEPLTLPQLSLPKNTMPHTLQAGDSITFQYDETKGDIESCVFTLYPLKDTDVQEAYLKTGKEQVTNFENNFDQPVTITPAFKGTWIFHLLGMYKSKPNCDEKGKRYAFYLDPEASCG